MKTTTITFCLAATLLINFSFSQEKVKLPDSAIECQLFERTLKCKKYIEQYYSEAIKGMLLYGVPASITLAQGLLESGMGESELAVVANNHFGVKCHVGWSGASYIYDDDEKGECFRKYQSPYESYTDHAKFLRFRPRYAFLFDLHTTNYNAWARGLKWAGYATDPKYADKLIAIIKENSLSLYDSIGNLLNLTSVNCNYPIANDSNMFAKQSETYSLATTTIVEDVVPAEPVHHQYIELIGKIRERKAGRGHAADVYVYKNDRLLAQYKATEKGKRRIQLPLNEQYKLVISENGFLSKTINIDTRVSCKNDTLYKFKYTMYLFEEIKNLNMTLFNDPVAFVALNSYNQFDYDDFHTLTVNRKVEEIYSNYYLSADK